MAAVQPKKVTGGAFGRYMAEHRAELMKECAGKGAFQDTWQSIKLGSERFKALGASAKAKYEQMYADAKHQYEKDLAAFLAAGGVKAAPKSKKNKEKKAKKDPNKPKQPAGGAFGCFLAKRRADLMKECAGKPVTAVTKLGSERWKALSAAEKLPYEKEFVEKKAAYAEAMKDYVPPPSAGDDEDDGDDDKEDEDREEEGEDDEDGEEDDAEEEEAEAPKKRKAGTEINTVAAKKGKTGATQSDVGAEAKKLGYAFKLKGLCDNPKIKASPSEILNELQKQQGSVVAAKKALLGA